jgi:hypothetical protein
MSLVGGAEPAAGIAKWLARAGAGPDRAILGPAGELEGKRPATDTGEEMALGVFPQISGLNIID